ncbi:MAG: hypothetical protein NTY07_05900 [Bacteroidia bacterium]|nr:hypothetical protein [Bacteroidia bacterium]
MKTTELRENIIQKVLQSDDDQLLDYLNQLLSEGSENDIYKLSEFEKAIITESQVEYQSGKVIVNEEIISRNDKWLNG